MKGGVREFFGNLMRGLGEAPDRLATGGRGEELQTMLSRDMTLAEAVDYHTREVWNFGGYEEALPHEAGHVILGLALNAPPRDQHLSAHPYQGTYDAEIYNIQIEHILNATVTGRYKEPYNDRQKFIMDVLSTYREFAVQENLMRTLGWLMEKQTGQSYEAMREEVHYSDAAFQDKARAMGITIDRSEDLKSWTVTAPGFEDAFFYHSPNDAILPGDLEGVEDFPRFERPSVHEIIEIYDRVLPAIHLLQNKAFGLKRAGHEGLGYYQEGDDALGETKVRDLYQAIVNRPSNEPVPEWDEPHTIS